MITRTRPHSSFENGARTFWVWSFRLSVVPGRGMTRNVLSYMIGSEKDAHELVDHQRLFAGHPFASRIHIEQGGAFEIFDRQEGMFDAVLIDIDKANYPKALERAIPRVRPGGLILADNVLWGGKTARPAAAEDGSTAALQAFNRQLVTDPRIQTAILPCGDGLSVSMKRVPAA